MLYVKEKETGKIHKVWKYLLSGDEQQNVWCHDWYGHHIIGSDCVFAKSVEYSSNQNNKPLVKSDVSSSFYSDGNDYSHLMVNSDKFPEHEECVMCGSTQVTITDDADICHDCGYVYT